jgi:hypothetical protein
MLRKGLLFSMFSREWGCRLKVFFFFFSRSMGLLDLVVWIGFLNYFEWTHHRSTCVKAMYRQGSSTLLCALFPLVWFIFILPGCCQVTHLPRWHLQSHNYLKICAFRPLLWSSLLLAVVAAYFLSVFLGANARARPPARLVSPLCVWGTPRLFSVSGCKTYRPILCIGFVCKYCEFEVRPWRLFSAEEAFLSFLRFSV